MKTKILLSISVCAFLSINIFYSSAGASECSLKPKGPIIEMVAAEAGRDVDCDYVKQVEKVIEGVQKFSEDKVPVNLYVRASYSGASFDGGTLIDLPEQLIFTTGNWAQTSEAVDIVANLSAVAHEYGHALLEKKMGRELGASFPIVKEYDEKHIEISSLQMKLAKNPDSEELGQELAAKKEALKNNLAVMKFFTLSTPYSELYADLVAAFADNDKNAISHALYFNSMSDYEYHFIQTRSFDKAFDPTYDIYMSEEHAYFAYARNYIGKSMWATSVAQKKLMLKKLSNAIVLELRDLLASNSNLPGFKEGNERLIKRLKSMK
jgi:hypothetical protein